MGDAKAPSLVEVPNLVGKDVFMANSVLGNGGLTLGDQKEVPSETIPEGEVTEQTPAAGTKVEAGCMVSVTVSSGPQKEKATATVPDVAGRSIEEVGRALEVVGLVLASSRSEKRSSEPAGTIISTEPSAGSEVEVGIPATSVVSRGPRGMSPGGVRSGLLAVSSGLRAIDVVDFEEKVDPLLPVG